MSLADLYKDDQTLSDEEEEEFVPSGSSSEDEYEDDADEPKEEPSDPVSEELKQQNKRRIDDIWNDMNDPQHKTPRTESNSPKQPDEPEQSPLSKPATHNADTNPTCTAARPPPRTKRPSKFSKMAELVEQRRAKKANTLDVARKAWSGFVSAEGIREDLDKTNKDGYVERQEFLDRVDHKTYERARDLGK
ncbi:hypothetical protein IWW49_001795 [Coemansia sp. RSA 1797]|nr:hypothetical protein IWW49_001795 [Coemansia sp. RSA 1797]